MTKANKLRRPKILRNQKAASPAVSMVIITAASVVMVLVASSYAFQLLIQQQAVAEFNTVQKSILAFDDAVRDIAYDRGGSRSVRFTASYGNMLLSDAAKSFEISTGALGFSKEFSTAVIKYSMPYTLTEISESPYIIGDANGVVSSLTESAGQAFVQQEAGSANIFLNYRVRVNAEGSSSAIIDAKTVNYVDIFAIRLICTNSIIGASDFDLVCKNVGLNTEQSPLYNLNGPIDVSVNVNDLPAGTVHLNLSGDQVIFNLILATVRVST